MVIVVRKNVGGWWKTMQTKMVAEDKARATYRRMEKRAEEINAELGERKYTVDCMNAETGEIIWHC